MSTYPKIKRNKLSIMMLFIFLLSFSINVSASDYSFPSLDITVQVEEDGSLFVQEKRTVIFNGKFSGFFQWINKQPGEEIVDIRVMEGDFTYEFNPSGEIGPAGTYFINDEPNITYIDWSFNAENESRIFVINYRIKNAIKLHEDIGEVYYIFNGDEWEKSVGILRAEMILPGDAEGNIRAWGHGPLNGNVEITGSDRVVWEINNLPSKTLVAGRVTFPLELIPNGTNFTGSPGLNNILATENSLLDKANNEKDYNNSVKVDQVINIENNNSFVDQKTILLILAFFGSALLIGIFLLFKKRTVENFPEKLISKELDSAKNETSDDNKIKNKNAQRGFILGIISIFLGFIGMIPLLAIIFSSIGLADFDKDIHNNKKQGVIGLILGIVYLFINAYNNGHFNF